jgi:hypothetical protein
MAAVEPSGLLAPVADSQVRVTSNGQDQLFYTDAAGDFEIDPAATAPGGAEVLVEADGRRQVSSLVQDQKSASKSNQVNVSFEYPVDSLVVGRPQTVVACFTDTGGNPLPSKTVRLRDSTGTSTIDGKTTEVELQTDANGKASFILTKTSVNHMTRLVADIEDVAGEIALPQIGGLELPASVVAGQVTAWASGPTDNLNCIELDNGIAKVTLDRSAPSRIITAITRGSISSRPLDDDLAVTPNATVSVRLASSSGNSAAYEISIDTPDVTKVWRVGLVRGEDFARVSCWFEKSISPATTNAYVMNAVSVDCSGARVTVSGEPVDCSKYVSPVLLSFNSLAPYASVATDDVCTAVAVPANSQVIPSGWLVSSTAITVRVPATILTREDAPQLQLLVSVGDAVSVQELGQKAMTGAGTIAPDSSVDNSGEGFQLVVTGTGQKSTVGVYKKYKSVF